MLVLKYKEMSTVPTVTPANVSSPDQNAVSTNPPVVGFSPDIPQANFDNAFGTGSPLFVTLAPSNGYYGKKKGMSALEIMLIATAVAVGVVTLCLLLSATKKK